MKTFLVKLYTAVIFINVEIEAFRKQVKSDIRTCHFDNTTCPLKSSSYWRNVSNKDDSCQKKKKSNSLNEVLLKNNTSFVQNYKDVMMISASAKTKPTCQNNTVEIIEKDRINSEPDLEVLLNEKEWKKNFASIECGAKLIKSSKNLKHPNHIINKNNDEYMLFECKEETFFIIELCETIKVIRFELDNFELYSGTPKNFTVRTIDKYSNNINQWIVIGNFEASSDKMEAQHFSDLEIKSFGKFIRVDINSFHGTEHFCTLTSFRVFGMSEYEYLALTDDDGDDIENDTGIEEENIHTESIVETRLQELEMKTHKNGLMKEQTTMLSYKYLFLQMRNDVCVDSVQFESFTKHGIVKNKENIQTIEVAMVEKKIMDVPQGKVTDINVPKKVQNLTKLDVNGSAPTVPKESVLVQISNRVKILEKNITIQNNILKNFNVSSKQQANDINKILETILKAKEVFQETVGETEAVKGDVNELTKKVTKFEELIGEYAEALKLMMALTVFLSILCLFLISLICFKPSDIKLVEVEEEVEVTYETIEEEDGQEEKCKNKDIHVQTDSPIIKKRVTFSDDEKEVKTEGSDYDISYKLTTGRRVRRRDPSRRVTWCGGTFRKLAEEAKFLVKEL